MGYDDYGLPASAPEPDVKHKVTPAAALTRETSSCKGSCCDGNDAEPLDTTAPDRGEPTQEKPDDCYSLDKCSDNKTENGTDSPDCCRGKVRPCCDASCLDRLAIRECEMSVAATLSPNGHPNSE
ncbi:Hypothetical protein PENO1_112230 [Penicillium occitanis (nom. inval.)]|jgi:Cu2+-exporting ATPase|nr:Hypothetical protein PENO1_112230 [Penicillium occitanis (nom. inval.)]